MECLVPQEPEWRAERVFGDGSGFAEPPRSLVTRPCASMQPSRTRWAKSSRGGDFEASNAFLDGRISSLVLMISLIGLDLAAIRPKYKPGCGRQTGCESVFSLSKPTLSESFPCGRFGNRASSTNSHAKGVSDGQRHGRFSLH